jgi:predicted aldo/keto reductase-like oxidoreductase
MLDEAEGLFEGMLLGLNALNGRMRLGAIREAARRGMGIGTMNSLAGGLLTTYAEHFNFLKQAGDQTILDTALRFNLSVPEVCVALVGFRNKQDVDTAVDAGARIQLLNASELDAFMDRVDESWEGFCTRCNYCAGCPVGVPVLHLMEAYNTIG